MMEGATPLRGSDAALALRGNGESYDDSCGLTNAGRGDSRERGLTTSSAGGSCGEVRPRKATFVDDSTGHDAAPTRRGSAALSTCSTVEGGGEPQGGGGGKRLSVEQLAHDPNFMVKLFGRDKRSTAEMDEDARAAFTLVMHPLHAVETTRPLGAADLALDHVVGV